MTCRDLDPLITPFVDDLSGEAERAAIVAHLRECQSCRTRVEVESTARHVLHAHAAVAKTMGVAPAWRPRVFRLGQPMLVVSPVVMLLVVLAGGGLAAWWAQPSLSRAFAPSIPAVPLVSAVGVIGDSYCQHDHSRRMITGERECTIGCVRAGAEFVLLTDTQVYRLRNQQLPELRTFANRRVRVEGTLNGGALQIARLTAVPAGD